MTKKIYFNVEDVYHILRLNGYIIHFMREGWLTHCPAHDDLYPSLIITQKDEYGRPLLHCQAGCTYGQIMKALRELRKNT